MTSIAVTEQVDGKTANWMERVSLSIDVASLKTE
jgi:hypothetical protein